jgi:hypothetical protein
VRTGCLALQGLTGKFANSKRRGRNEPGSDAEDVVNSCACPVCKQKVVESLEHFVVECPALHATRQLFFATLATKYAEAWAKFECLPSSADKLAALTQEQLWHGGPVKRQRPGRGAQRPEWAEAMHQVALMLHECWKVRSNALLPSPPHAEDEDGAGTREIEVPGDGAPAL